MRREEILKWFETIAASRHQIGRAHGESYEHEAAVEWMTTALAALEAAFPTNHAVLRSWEQAQQNVAGNGIYLLSSKMVVDTATAVFRAAHAQVKAGYLGTLADAVRVETESELLDQATHLADKGYLIAAAVVAGGALETHLSHLCRRSGLSVEGPGSISKYNNAIGQKRKAGMEVYTTTDGKIVEGWGGIRNDAAHRPGSFDRTEGEIRQMVDGIREFIARVS